MEKEYKLKIYEIVVNGADRVWVAAHSIFEALHYSDIPLYDFEPEDEIKEVPELKWGDCTITDELGIVEMTFADWMQRNNTPGIIALSPLF